MNLFFRALSMGIVAGSRSMAAPAMVGQQLASRETKDGKKSWLRIGSPAVKFLLGVMAAGELIADKLPGTPNRTDKPSVIFRALSGALAGGAVYGEHDRPLILGALFGAAGSFIGTYGGFHLRKSLVEKTGMPDPIIAVAEDALAVGLAKYALSD